MKCSQCRRNYKINIKRSGKESVRRPAKISFYEIGEVIDIIKKNGDKSAVADSSVREHLIEEMADVLMYYNDVMLCYGITEDELKQAYIEKFQKNMKRW